ncbi:hypothetical protein ACGF4C_00650 [Streptomyces sp. NPDC048197]|uniref:hypothetical protein n=1 Tax=Streptomyces sp. NPDC048197 TaxID=3365511 RepID=UPI00371F6323
MTHHPNCPDCLRAAHIHGHTAPEPPEPDPPIRAATFILLFLVFVVIASGWIGLMWLVAQDVGWP